ncbi:MAG: hypothetical protein ABI775_07960 [Pseudonocardiales bacterium]
MLHPERCRRLFHNRERQRAVLAGLHGESLAAAAARIFQRMIVTESGWRNPREELGFGHEEFVPWQLGAVM